ncbi:MAG: hypothetical protein L0H79_05270 [Intrasporangium sp.]|uniref:hypothetical protein n=1 Tax=Intrasporangium sp. TaxID=1925024 RepID=UPI002649B2B4|nr:hypothetical protein [Intrasporangium sp.]MDN5795146.1 hypothetical protein [Intrasporangium sp.]
MDVLTYLLATVFNVALVSFIVRRLLGVPVGWPRTIMLSLIFQAGASGLLAWVGRTLGLDLRIGSPQLRQAVAVLLLVTAWLVAVQVALLTARPRSATSTDQHTLRRHKLPPIEPARAGRWVRQARPR